MTLGNSDSRKKKGEGAEERGGKWGAGEEGEEEAKGKKKEKRKVLNVRSVELQVGPGCLLRRDWGNVQVARGGAGSVSGVRPPPAPRGWRAVWGRKGTRGDRDEREAHTKHPTCFPSSQKKPVSGGLQARSGRHRPARHQRGSISHLTPGTHLGRLRPKP